MTAITRPHDTAPSPLTKPPRKKALYYPTGDGKPMAEDTLHRDLMFYAIASLQFHFADRPDVYISGNDFLYYEEGNPQARVSPDCYVVIGVQKHYRPFYKVWEENGIPPAVVFEFTSKKTRREDTAFKQPLYEQRLQVGEYIQFDPTGDYLKPRLQGQQLHQSRYQSMPLQDNRMFSTQLGLELVIEGEDLRFWDPVQGEWLITYTEAQSQRIAEGRRAEIEARRADTEARRADTEARRADAQAEIAADSQAEVARLRAELAALRQQS